MMVVDFVWAVRVHNHSHACIIAALHTSESCTTAYVQLSAIIIIHTCWDVTCQVFDCCQTGKKLLQCPMTMSHDISQCLFHLSLEQHLHFQHK